MKVNDLVAKLNKLAADKDFNELLAKAITHDDFHGLVMEYFAPHLPGLTMHMWAAVTEHKKEVVRYNRHFVPYKNSRMHNRGKFSNLTFHPAGGCGNINLADIEAYFSKKEKEESIANLKQSIKEQEKILSSLHNELQQLEKGASQTKEKKCRQ